jgi:excisionase family DNA binding protein
MSTLINSTPKTWLNIEEAASYLGISKDELYRLTRSDKITHFQRRKRGLIKFKSDWLDEWINRYVSGPNQAAVAPKQSKPQKPKKPEIKNTRVISPEEWGA